jgi:hypothetical protein
MAEEMTPGIREWRGLYESAIRVKEISPWEWMTETDVFGVRSPESGELGFVSVMGLLGEHYAVSLYLGSEGIHGFLDLQEMGPFADPGALIQIPQIQASFENREELEKRDREIIKDLGLKFRGETPGRCSGATARPSSHGFWRPERSVFYRARWSSWRTSPRASERTLLCWSLPAAIVTCFAPLARKGGGVSGKMLRRVCLHLTLRPSKSRWRRPRSRLSGGCREGKCVWRWTSSCSPRPSRMRGIVRTSRTCCW